MVTESMADRYGGNPPCGATMCDECEGMGFGPSEGATFDTFGETDFVTCEDCGGTGRKTGKHPLLAAAVETFHGFVAPLRFGWFVWRRYGFAENLPAQGVRTVWRDNHHNRRAILRAVFPR